MFNDRLEIHNNTMVKIQHTWHTHYHGSPHRGGGHENRRSPHPSSKIKPFFLLYGWPFSYVFFSMWGPFWYVFPLMGGPFHHVRAFQLSNSARLAPVSGFWFWLIVRMALFVVQGSSAVLQSLIFIFENHPKKVQI